MGEEGGGVPSGWGGKDVQVEGQGSRKLGRRGPQAWMPRDVQGRGGTESAHLCARAHPLPPPGSVPDLPSLTPHPEFTIAGLVKRGGIRNLSFPARDTQRGAEVSGFSPAPPGTPRGLVPVTPPTGQSIRNPAAALLGA